MLDFNNEDTVALHITKMCNLRCDCCYQHDYSGYAQTVDLAEAFKAIDIIKPKNLVLFGGEALVQPKIIKKVFERYPDKGYIIQTNGTIYNKEILDRVDVIYLTLEHFLKDKAAKHRPLDGWQFKSMINVLHDYKDKTIIIHNIYPDDYDSTFYRLAALYGIEVQSYPMVTDSTDMVFAEESARYLPVRCGHLTKPKLRVLEDGTITRDMRGVYNICKADDWKEEYRDYELPIHEKCLTCKYFDTCPACAIFPHFCKDVLDMVELPHFCQYTIEANKRGLYE